MSEDKDKDEYEDKPLIRSAVPETEQRCPDCKARPGDKHQPDCRYAPS